MARPNELAIGWTGSNGANNTLITGNNMSEKSTDVN